MARQTRGKDWFENLIETGKKRGHVSLDELNSALPKAELTPEQLNDVMYKLNEMGVEIVNSEAAQDEEMVLFSFDVSQAFAKGLTFEEIAVSPVPPSVRSNSTWPRRMSPSSGSFRDGRT